MFCYLEQVGAVARGGECRRQVLALARTYLKTAKRESAYATFMAGEMLGYSWPAAEAMEELLELAERADTRIGRASAVHGLWELWQRVGSRRRETIERALAIRVSSDRSAVVRRAAQFELRRCREERGKIRDLQVRRRTPGQPASDSPTH